MTLKPPRNPGTNTPPSGSVTHADKAVARADKAVLALLGLVALITGIAILFYGVGDGDSIPLFPRVFFSLASFTLCYKLLQVARSTRNPYRNPPEPPIAPRAPETTQTTAGASRVSATEPLSTPTDIDDNATASSPNADQDIGGSVSNKVLVGCLGVILMIILVFFGILVLGGGVCAFLASEHPYGYGPGGN